jgi:hypothetical protein
MEFETIEIEQSAKSIYTRYGLEFSMVGTEKNFAYNFGPCKEYVLDYTLHSITGDGRGSPYFASMKKVSLDEVRIACKGANEFALKSLDFINAFEKGINYPLTVIKQASNDKNVLVFCGSPKWFIAPPMVSLYALLIRAGQHHVIGNDVFKTVKYIIDNANRCTDGYNLGQSICAIQAILKYGPEKIFGSDMKANWPVGVDIHNRGILSFGTNVLMEKFPQWYEFLKLENKTRFPGY